LLVSPVRATVRTILIVASATLLGSHAPVREPSTPQRSSRDVATNPTRLRALQLLERRKAGVAPRVRFEWDAVPGARRYALTGRWTSPPSWAIQSTIQHVTRQNATVWDSQRVAFELSIPEGTHSWSVVALFGPSERGDFDHPTSVSFEIR
jgi:hypothetical protein